MRPQLTWYRLRWPREVEPGQVEGVLRLLATAGGTPIVIQAAGRSGQVDHDIAVPYSWAGSIVNQMRAAIPGLAVERYEPVVLDLSRAVQLRLSTRRRPLRGDDLPGIARALLTALAHVGEDETLVLQWILGRPVTARPVPNRLEGAVYESWTTELLGAAFGGPGPDRSRTAQRAPYQAGRTGMASGRPAGSAGGDREPPAAAHSSGARGRYGPWRVPASASGCIRPRPRTWRLRGYRGGAFRCA